MRLPKIPFSIPIPRIRRRPLALPEPGSPPGTFVVSTELPPPQIERHVYDGAASLDEGVEPENLAAALAPQPGKVTWVDIQGLGHGELIRQVGQLLGLHPLTLEDIVHTHQRPKVEELEGHMFVVLRAVRLDAVGGVDNEQLSFVLKPGLLVTFQERAGDGFDPVRRRLRQGLGQIRHHGADYLLAALLDAAIDNYFPVLELYGDTMDALDEALRQQPGPAVAAAVHSMRRELRQLRRAVWPLRDVAAHLGRSENPLLHQSVRPMLRDCHDHVVQVADFVEGARERSSELADLYLVMMGERTNQVMKVLTIIATIFIPLTFICGLYGMNFDPASPYNMPELKWRFGYPAVLLLMTLVLLGEMLYFRHKGWLRS